MSKKPVVSADDVGLPAHLACPFCGGDDTELHNAFGPQLSVSTYWCRRCRSPFEAFKWTPRPAPERGADPPE